MPNCTTTVRTQLSREAASNVVMEVKGMLKDGMKKAHITGRAEA